MFDSGTYAVIRLAGNAYENWPVFTDEQNEVFVVHEGECYPPASICGFVKIEKCPKYRDKALGV